jgi:hypothetical protein
MAAVAARASQNGGSFLSKPTPSSLSLRPQSSCSWTGRVFPSRGRALASLLIGALSIAGLSGCASAGPFNPSHLAPTQLSQVQQLCRSVMGISIGTGLFSDCVENASGSAVAIAQARALAAARRSCLDKGLAPGQVGLSQCELTKVSQRSAPALAAADVQVDTSGLEKPAKSYYYASFDEGRRREQDVCVRLGYDPINTGFAQCVASLDTAIFASLHPMQ